MINEPLLRQGLQKLLKETESAIRDRLSDEPTLEAKLREHHAAAVRAERTEGSTKGYNAFANEAITEAAVHWLLGCVFVRFLEDNGWLDERNAKVAWIAGSPDRLAIAKDRRTLFLRPDPNLTDRDYLLHVFAEVAKLPGVVGLFDQRHNPLYSLQPTAHGAAKIVEFFQKVDPDSNDLIHDFTDPTHGTRFLGDLYQNLSESARKLYALCQTPGFVIDFILDRTLTPALDAFGLEAIRIIDPCCGSGHFLLAAFSRLFRFWQNKEPGTNPPALAQRALDSVYGVDVLPFAVEISRFRLLIAALEASGIERLWDAPNFRFNLAAGDSLLHGSRVGGGGIERNFFEDRLQYFYNTEDGEELKRILGQQYHVVVGNPPYINVSDPVLREAYRARFATCHGKYQLGVPFTERFFDLTIRGEAAQKEQAGWMGMIVSDAFMKRTFGKKLIENYLCHRDLTHVIYTGGVYLPGHGTPTVILLARNRQPVASTIRAVRGIRGEDGVPDDPSEAPVWREITDNIDRPGFVGIRVSVSDADRQGLSIHPWSFGGGGAAELKEKLDNNCETILANLVSAIGPASFPGLDEAFVMNSACGRRYAIDSSLLKDFLVGDNIEDWSVLNGQIAFAPYDKSLALIDISLLPEGATRWLWPNRSTLRGVISFGNKTREQLGEPWWGWYRWIKERLNSPLSLAYPFVETHNKFVLDRGGNVFNRAAPLIKLKPEMAEAQHLEIMGLLNSSTACFWLKAVSYPKGGDHVGTEGARVRKLMWDVYYEFDSTNLRQFPIPAGRPLSLAQQIQGESDARSALLPTALCAIGTITRSQLDNARGSASAHLSRMISLQEELDWQCYGLYGIVEEELTFSPNQVPPLRLGERAFEILMARAKDEPLWFERHCSTPITELPADWPRAYKKLVERRIAAIENNRDIALIERPEYKRRWNLPTWEDMESAALKSWLLDRVESNTIWRDHTLVSCSQLRDTLARDSHWLSLADVYHRGPIEDLGQFIVDLVTPEAVTFLPILRYTETGLRKRADWEHVWRLQREEDAGAKVGVSVPPKYISKDFQAGYWRLRGSLDVPKERFILYQAFQRESDGTPVLGWAGWSHLEQARALAAYYQRMRTEEGWEPERLKPILAGLLDLREWLKQWHDDVDAETGLKLGTYFSEFAEAQCQELGFSPQEVLSWQPPAGTSTGRREKSKAK
ncbi:MAG: BREX-2 system adenine-specific DNA-methyltransferase PglX [Acidobacteriia bacterium]|nr:BREX-2 system adenine-specific DNA-methyltransferase PglX [Terriglobia bacterium]